MSNSSAESPEPNPRILQILLLLLGTALLAGGGLLGVQLLRTLAAHQGRGSALVAAFLWIGLAGAAAAIAWGAVTAWWRRSRAVARANALLAFYLLLAPLLLEVVLRAGITLEVPALRQAELFASPYSSDDYHKLVHLWSHRPAPPATARPLAQVGYDPELGWGVAPSEDNPLGALTDEPYRLDPERRNLLFYGDSFVAHGEPMATKIPQQLDALLPDVDVHNLAMGGFGIDQIYLQLERTLDQVDQPLVVVGIYTADMDRCLLGFRNRPKPRFVLGEAGLELQGVPVEPDVDTFLANQPVGIRSYALAALQRALVYLQVPGGSLYTEERRGEKEAITTALLEALVERTRDQGLELIFVVFVPRSGNTWRRDFLIGEIERLGVPYVDTEALFRRSMAEDASLRFVDFYDRTSHLSPEAHALVAREIADTWTPLAGGG